MAKKEDMQELYAILPRYSLINNRTNPGVESAGPVCYHGLINNGAIRGRR